MNRTTAVVVLVLLGLTSWAEARSPASPGANLERLRYNHPGLIVDLGVGLWASPLPIFKPGRRIGPGPRNAQVSYVDGEPRVLVPGHEYVDFRASGLDRRLAVYPETQIHRTEGRVRANQWKYADWEPDSDLDLIVGVGDWTGYGWDDAFDAKGEWVRGPLRCVVYLILNRGSSDEPRYDPSAKIEAAGRPLEVFGMPSPNLADMDGDLDIVCGEFLDRLSYFENVSDQEHPRYAEPRFLEDDRGVIHLDLQMIVPVALDWDGDGDLVVGEEDGRVAYVENTGRLVDGAPRFARPRHFEQEAHVAEASPIEVRSPGTPPKPAWNWWDPRGRQLVTQWRTTPAALDFDGDGLNDLVMLDHEGFLALFPRRRTPDGLKLLPGRRIFVGADGAPLKLSRGRAGKSGRRKLAVVDWDGDGQLDVLVNGTNAELLKGQAREDGTHTLANRGPIGQRDISSHSTSPTAVDWNRHGVLELLVGAEDGFLYYLRRGRTE